MTKKFKAFISGMGSVLDVAPPGGLDHQAGSLNGVRSDREALSRDWHNVGGDIRRGIKRFEQEKRARRGR